MPGKWCVAALMMSTAALGAKAGESGFGSPIVVTAGAEEMFANDTALEFKVIPSGQVFASVGVSSLAVQEGFLQNDCTFGTLPNCNWSPLGNNSPVDMGVTLVPLTSAQIAAYEKAFGVDDGPPIQFPLYGTALAIAVANSAVTKNGQIVLGDGELCGIFSGQITDWSQVSLTATPGPFQIVYDSRPGSGITWLLTQHLAAVCDSTNSMFTQLPVPVTSDFTKLPVPGGVANNPEFVGAAGNANIATQILGSPSAIGYVGPNYTSILPHSPLTTKALVAYLYNSNDGHVYAPNRTNATLALANPGSGSSNTSPPSNQQQAADPTKWVPIVPSPAAGYPIVGWSNWILSTCYLSISQEVLQYLGAPTNPGKHLQIAEQQGFAPLATVSTDYATAVVDILLSNADGYNLQIQNPVACSGRARHDDAE